MTFYPEDRRCADPEVPTVSDGAGRAVRGIALGIALGALVLGACSMVLVGRASCARTGEAQLDPLTECWR